MDTETDGFIEPVHVVEIAAQRMRGWQRDGEAFRVLLNHDVPIDPMAEALHGYSREYLREHGQEPETAHGRWREYAADQPIVAYNITFDWNRALEPEYARLGLPPAGRRGFCAMTLAVGVIIGAAFGNIVKSLTEDVIMSPIGKLLGGLGGLNFKDYFIPLDGQFAAYKTLEQAKASTPVIAYGRLLRS